MQAYLDLTLVLGHLLQHLLLHELDCDNPVLGEVVALVDHSVVSLAQLLRAVDVKIIVDLLHALRCELHVSDSFTDRRRFIIFKRGAEQ